MNNINLMGIVSIFCILIGSTAVNASGFLPPTLMTMSNSTMMTNWTANSSSSIVYVPVNGLSANGTPNGQISVNLSINTTTSSQPAPSIIKTLNYGNGQTFGFIATNDPTGLGVRSNMNYLCTMYSFLFGIMQYFQTNSYTC